MPEFETYKNHELMQVASELMRSEFELHELQGGQYDGFATKAMAQKIIFTCMPHVMDYLEGRVIVEASQAQVVIPPEPAPKTVLDTPQEATLKPVEGLYVEAKFKNVEFQPVIRREALPELGGSFIVEDYDLFAVMQPQYFDPEPGDLVFGDAVMVPFGEVTRFDPSERRAA